MESRKESEISNALFDMLDDPFNAKLPDLAVVNLYKLAKDRRIWLDIAVADVVRVDVTDSLDELAEKLARFIFLEAAVFEDIIE